MEVRAQKRMLRVAPRKARLVTDLVRGKDCWLAISILRNSKVFVAKDVEKLISSAMANAEHNNDMDINNLFISKIYADEGPTLKRVRAGSRGSASRINKRTSTITVFVAEKE